jgi:hypothetical protein
MRQVLARGLLPGRIDALMLLGGIDELWGLRMPWKPGGRFGL